MTELAFHNDEFAVKVTEVALGSPAAQARRQTGTLILSANGKPILHPTELNDAVNKSSGSLRLTVLDSSTGGKKDVVVSLVK